jgi:hypothetical protein
MCRSLVDAQKSSKIMKDIAELIGKYPVLNDKIEKSVALALGS